LKPGSAGTAGVVTADRDAGTVVPEQWIAVLNAVSEACAAEHASSASTGVISLRIRGVSGRTARTLLRVLRRRGYVCTTGDSVDGAPLHWALTPAGRALRTRLPHR
jgi:DNA-binding transcriptional ArsR family regulator